MKCPHCLVEFHFNPATINIGSDIEGHWYLEKANCPSCKKDTYSIANGYLEAIPGGGARLVVTGAKTMIRPKGANRPPVPEEVTKAIAEDYTEACLVLPDSPKASAALSRRCLQTLLREKASIKSGDLYNEIQQAIDSNQLPSYLSENLNHIRVIGNFAAHPMKFKTTGEIVPVEMGEAEWNLEVLEMLFDFYFVQPARAQSRRDALNIKIADSAKT